MSDVSFECYYACPCGRKVVAFDDKVVPNVCVCGLTSEPVKVTSYNMTQVHNWLFWDQVFGYGEDLPYECSE